MHLEMVSGEIVDLGRSTFSRGWNSLLTISPDTDRLAGLSLEGLREQRELGANAWLG